MLDINFGLCDGMQQTPLLSVHWLAIMVFKLKRKHPSDAYLALCVCCQQYVPCSKVSVDETLLGEVLHSIGNLLTEPEQLISHVNVFSARSTYASRDHQI